MMAAAFGRSVQGIGLDLDDRDLAVADYTCATLELPPSKIGHLTETLSGLEDVQDAVALGDLHFTRRQDEERRSGLSLPDQRRGRRNAMPVRDVENLPDIHVGEIVEEVEPAQRIEFFRVGD